MNNAPRRALLIAALGFVLSSGGRRSSSSWSSTPGSTPVRPRRDRRRAARA